MVPKWLTSYLANYVINKWSTAFGPISNPSVFEVLHLVKYFGGFRYFISHDIKNRFKNTVTLLPPHRSPCQGFDCLECVSKFHTELMEYFSISHQRHEPILLA
jgi:hypothetical protein